MKTLHYALTVAILACSTSARVTTSEHAATRTERKTFSVSPGGNLYVQNTNGRIAVSTWERNTVRVIAEAESSAPTQEEAERLLEETEIYKKQSGNTVNIETRRSGWKLEKRRRL